MTNGDRGNAVAVFNRAPDGTLTAAGTCPTGGLGTGGAEIPVDPLGSQGALILSKDGRFLFAVNAGSDEVSVLAVEGEGLTLVDKVPSGGVRPVGLTVHGHLLYVLNSTDGTITGFTVDAQGKLSALAGSTQPLIGGSGAVPGQVAFAPDGNLLVVTEKATDVIDVFVVDEHGCTGPPVRNNSNGATPFGFTFAGEDLLIVSEASGATSSYRVAPKGTLQVVSGSVSTTQIASCWVTTNSNADPRYAYVTNTGSGSISGYRIEDDGTLCLSDEDGRTGVTGDPSFPIDITASGDGRFLHVLTGRPDDFTVVGFRIEPDGSLTSISGAGELPLGTQGIAAS
ncbi:MAG: lactonase family protein [Pseudonocardiaceae bacterium]